MSETKKANKIFGGWEAATLDLAKTDSLKMIP
jgi:hypothetical protein